MESDPIDYPIDCYDYGLLRPIRYAPHSTPLIVGNVKRPIPPLRETNRSVRGGVGLHHRPRESIGERLE